MGLVEHDNAEKKVEYGQTGRVMLTTLTKETFIPRLPWARNIDDAKSFSNYKLQKTILSIRQLICRETHCTTEFCKFFIE